MGARAAPGASEAGTCAGSGGGGAAGDSASGAGSGTGGASCAVDGVGSVGGTLSSAKAGVTARAQRSSATSTGAAPRRASFKRNMAAPPDVRGRQRLPSPGLRLAVATPGRVDGWSGGNRLRQKRRPTLRRGTNRIPLQESFSPGEARRPVQIGCAWRTTLRGQVEGGCRRSWEIGVKKSRGGSQDRPGSDFRLQGRSPGIVCRPSYGQLREITSVPPPWKRSASPLK
jgi:hypothetical protein